MPGDANRDGRIDVADLGILAANYNLATGAAWEQGDFNGDGKVDVGDLGILAANYGAGTGISLDFNADAQTLGLVSEDDRAKEIKEDIVNECGPEGLVLLAGSILAVLGLNGWKVKM